MAILIFLFGCSSSDTTTKETEASEVETNTITFTVAQMKNIDISYDSLHKSHMPATIKVNGIIDVPPQNLVSVSMPLGGYLKFTKLLPGMHVRKGETIAVMEDQQYIQLQQDYLSAKSKMVYYESEFNRQKDLNENKASSDKVLAQAKMEYDQLKINIRGLAEKLHLLGINPASLNDQAISRTVYLKAPIDGFVSKVNVNAGKYVNPSDVLFELVNPEDIHLNLRVFESDFSKLSIGQKVNAYTNTHPEKKYECDIILISKDVLPDRSIEVHCHFDNYDNNLIPGMYMNAVIDLARSEVQVLPEESVLQYQGASYVIEARGKNTFDMLEVKTGASHEGVVEIKDGGALSGKLIVRNGAYTILMALKNKEEE